MEFHIVREHLFKLLNRIQSVAERRNTMPILSYALLEAEEDTLTISATDLDVSIRTSGPADVVQPGRMAVQAKKLFEVVRELPDHAEIRIRHDPQTQRLFLTAGKARFTLAGVAADEFPALPEADGNNEFILESAILANLIGKTQFAVSTDETRVTLSSALVQFMPATEESPSRIRMVATDTHRLAMADHLVEAMPEQTLDAILPRKSLQELRKMLDEDSTQNVRLVIGENHLQAIKPGITLISKLVAGRYPNYHKVIPTQNDHILMLEKDLLKSSVKRMAVLSNEKSQGILLEITTDQVKINSDNPEQEAGEEELTAEYHGPRLVIGFNIRYLLEILNALDGAVARFHFRDDEAPVLVTDPTQAELLYVLMPIRI